MHLKVSYITLKQY